MKWLRFQLTRQPIWDSNFWHFAQGTQPVSACVRAGCRLFSARTVFVVHPFLLRKNCPCRAPLSVSCVPLLHRSDRERELKGLKQSVLAFRSEFFLSVRIFVCWVLFSSNSIFFLVARRNSQWAKNPLKSNKRKCCQLMKFTSDRESHVTKIFPTHKSRHVAKKFSWLNCELIGKLSSATEILGYKSFVQTFPDAPSRRTFQTPSRRTFQTRLPDAFQTHLPDAPSRRTFRTHLPDAPSSFQATFRYFGWEFFLSHKLDSFCRLDNIFLILFVICCYFVAFWISRCLGIILGLPITVLRNADASVIQMQSRSTRKNPHAVEMHPSKFKCIQERYPMKQLFFCMSR